MFTAKTTQITKSPAFLHLTKQNVLLKTLSTIVIVLMVYDGIGSLYVKRKKSGCFLAKHFFSVLGLFQAVLLAQALRYCQVQNYE